MGAALGKRCKKKAYQEVLVGHKHAPGEHEQLWKAVQPAAFLPEEVGLIDLQGNAEKPDLQQDKQSKGTHSLSMCRPGCVVVVLEGGTIP